MTCCSDSAPSRLWATLGAAAALAALLVACLPKDGDSPVVARVGDAALTRADLDDLVPATADVEVAAATRRALAEEWIREQLLYQEAMASDLAANARLRRLIEQARRDLLVAAFINREFEDQEVKVSDDQVQTYYYQHVDEFTRTDAEIRVQQVLLQSSRDAGALRQRLVAGSISFDEAAREYSLDEPGSAAGDGLGYFSAEQDPLLWELCQDQPLDRVSMPLSSERGYYIVRVLDRKEPGTPKEVEQVRDQIADALVRQAHRQRLDDLLARLKEKRSWQLDLSQLDAAP
ncbi:MAG: peptidyl-prolyl cis-trans isomerase [Gemmatimonadota bacterium]